MPKQYCRHTDDTFIYKFVNEDGSISIKIPLNFPNMILCNSALKTEAVTIGSGNGLAPNRRQVIIWTNGGPV